MRELRCKNEKSLRHDNALRACACSLSKTNLLGSLAEGLREEGHAVDEAPDGEEGLAKALHCDYGAIALDVMLPRLSGFALLERLRVRNERPC